MKLKNKFYLIQFFILLALIILTWTMYTSFHQQNHNNLENELKKNVYVTTLLLHSALKDTYRTFEQRKSFFTHIHRTTLTEFKKDESISLEQLKNKMMRQFHLKDLVLDLFIIDKNYVITDSTFKKDIGLDFKNILDVKEYLDHVSKDDKIHMEHDVFIDNRDSSIKLYSCVSVDHDKFLQIAFIDSFIYKKLSQTILDISKSTKNKISLFRITKTSSNEQFYENIMKGKEIINKEEYFKLVRKFPLNSITDDKIINAQRENTIIRTDENVKENTVSFWIPLSIKENENSLLYKNFVLQLEIDVSSYYQWRENTTIFIGLNIILFALMFILYYYIKNYFYIPITKITQDFEKEVRIDDPSLLIKKDEFGTLVHKYNTLYTKLQDQIINNQELLENNKQFITDIVHQIRTPLTVIMTNASLIEMKTEAAVSSYVMHINSAINMLSNSYEDLSYIVSHDSIEYKATEINFTKFFNDRIDFFEIIAQANDKTICRNIEKDIMVYMNDIELERLIDNNISNAIKHSSEKSDIKIVLEKNKSEIVLKFISQGKKIRDPSMVFDKNYTESHSAKRSLGLGLNMVKTICEKNSITHSVQSEESTNTFTYIFNV